MAAHVENGVNVEQLVGTVNAIKGQPGIARFKFRTTSQWGGGAKSTASVKSFYGAGQEDGSRTQSFRLEGDEPPVLLGTNTAPNAVEALLAALSGCMTVAFVYPAAAEGIKVHELSFAIEGDVDLQGFLKLSDKVRPGLQGVTVIAHVKADAPKARIRELLEHAVSTSPVMDSLRNPVPVTVHLAE
jgi:uncharacterized OsmC-like protein